MNVAIPDVMGAFGIDQVKAQWLSTGFLAAMTATMLLTDWADRAFGQRGSIMAALALFMGGSVLGGLAPDEDVLILARIVQGAAAGIVQPLAMIIIFRAFPPDRRGAAMGIFGIGVVLAPALGLWVGGLLMDSFNWRYVFYLGVPFAALGIGLAGLLLPTREGSGPDLAARPGAARERAGSEPSIRPRGGPMLPRPAQTSTRSSRRLMCSMSPAMRSRRRDTAAY